MASYAESGLCELLGNRESGKLGLISHRREFLGPWVSKSVTTNELTRHIYGCSEGKFVSQRTVHGHGLKEI